MKRIIYSILSLAVISFYACGGGHEEGSHDEAMNETEAHGDHDGHDHAAMEEAANSNAFKEASADAKVFFVNLKEGDMVSSPLKVEMGAEGITVHPAGEIIDGTGHHHIIVDGVPVPSGDVVPADETHIHFGGGQTETELELAPGSHTLTLQFADGLHRSYGEAMSATIKVEVQAAN